MVVRHILSYHHAIVPLSVIAREQFMDRRQFLSAVSVLGSCRFAHPDMAFASRTADSDIFHAEDASSPDTEHALKVGVVAIGSSGNWILNRLHGKLPYLFRSAAVATDPLLMHRVSADRRFLIDNQPSNIRPVAGPALAAAVADEISRLIEGVDQLFILADMGSTREEEVASVVARHAHRANIFTVGAVSSPLGDPKNFGHQLAEGHKRLIELGVPTISLSDRRYRGATTLPGLMETAIAFERLYRGAVLSQESDQSFISLDRDSVREFFSQIEGPSMVVGYGSANGADSAQLSAHRAISHFLFDADRERSDIEVLVFIEAGPRRLKMREINRVLGVISDALPYCIPVFGALPNPLLNDDFHVTVVAPEAPWKTT